MNLDAIRLAQELPGDTALRVALVGAAETFVASAEKDADVNGVPKELSDLKKVIDTAQVLLGWEAGDLGKPWTDGSALALWVLGCLITALAGTLGAPFRFDLLGKIAHVRSTLRPKEETVSP